MNKADLLAEVNAKVEIESLHYFGRFPVSPQPEKNTTMLGTEKQKSYALSLIAQISRQLEDRRAEESASLELLEQGLIRRPGKSEWYAAKIERQHTFLAEITRRLEWMAAADAAAAIIDNRDRLSTYLNVPFQPI